jgi:hypothetical protein
VGGLQINLDRYGPEVSKEDKHAIIMHEVTHALAFIIADGYTDNWTSHETGRKHKAITKTV